MVIRGGKIYTPSTISTLSVNQVKALWIAIDRVGLAGGWGNLPEAFRNEETINALKSYVKAGGNLLLTTHATQLVVALSRVSDIYAPGIFGSGNGGENPDVWGINAMIGCNPDFADHYDHRSHPIYQNLAVNSDMYRDHSIYPLIGNGWKEDHNCMWDFNGIAGLENNPNKLVDFENKTNSSVIGTWQHVTDYACAGVIEFKPTADYKGTILCNGIAAYEWHQNNTTNPYQDNIEKLTGNCLDYLKTLGNTAASTTASITVDGKESYWGTFYSSSAKTLPEGVTAYVVSTAENGYAQLEKVAEGGQVIPGGEGYLLSTATAQSEMYLTDADAAQAVTVGSNLLKGSDEEASMSGEGTYYVLGRTGEAANYTYGLYWQKGTEGKSVKNAAHKAYLLIPATSEAKALTLTFGEATGIQQLAAQTADADTSTSTYNVAGQRVGKGYKGLAVKNGKKYILK